MLLAPSSRGLARVLHLICLALTVATAAVFAQTNTPSAADGYDPNVDGNVFASVTQGDGKLVVVGQFANATPNGGISISRINIARFNPDGSLDGAYAPNVSGGAIRAIALQGDKVIIGGDFTSVGGEAHNKLARLNADGSVDSTFRAAVDVSTTGPAIAPQVLALAVQPDGAVIAGGTFGTAQSPGVSKTRNNIARFSASGVLDATYDPNPNSTVLALAVQFDQNHLVKVVVGGSFTQFQENGKTTPTTRQRIARLNPDGTLDSDFDPKADNGVATIAVQRDGKILLGGYFTTLQPPGNDASGRSHVARLNIDGTLDSEFYPNISGNVLSVAVGPDGGIFIGGNFTQVSGRGGVSASRSYSAKLLPDGTIDDTFYPNVNGVVDTFAFQPDGKVILGGYFTRAQTPGLATSVIRNHVARILPNGALDTAFQINAGGRILASVTDKNGNVIVAGSFTNIGGLTRYFVARLNGKDGSVDASYNPRVNDRVYALAYDKSSDKVIIGGAFTQIGPAGAPSDRNHIARLNPDGSVDSEFNPNIDGPVATIVLPGDGNILVGGSFANVHPFGTTDAVARANILRLTSTGQVDTAFNPTTNGQVSGIALEPSSGKMIVVGNFTGMQPGATGKGTSRNYIARLNSDGTVDSDYNPNPNPQSGVNAVVMQSDGKAVVGGRFVAFFPPKATAAVYRNYIARINSDGSIDTTFDPHANNTVLTLALQSDGKIVAGGTFTTFTPTSTIVSSGSFTSTQTTTGNWVQAKYVGRLNTDGTVDTTFNLDIPELIGNRVDSISIDKYRDSASTNNILIGGSFISLQPVGSPNRVLRNNFARIHPDGTLDTAFDPGAGGSVSGTINALALQTDGKIVVGGTFSDLGGATSTNIARFNQEGTPDGTFNAAISTDGPVNALAVRANGVITPTQLAGFAWLNTNGTMRGSFAPKVTDIKLEGQMYASLVQPDGKILLAGLFSDLTNHAKSNLIRLNADGTLDGTFNPDVNGAVYGMLLQPADQKVIIYGAFTSVSGTTRNYVARLKQDGTLDQSGAGYSPNPNGVVVTAVLLSDGSVVIGGSFTGLTPNANTTSTTRNYLAKIDTQGALVDAFNPNLNGAVNSIVLDSSGKFLVGGSFTTAQPNSSTTVTTRSYMARFNADGTLDTSFDPEPNGPVSAIALQGSSILIGGSFLQIQPVLGGNRAAVTTHYGLARLGSDGNTDETFKPTLNSGASTITVQGDNSILVGGTFNLVKSNGSDTWIARNHFARFDATGSLDPQFNPDFSGTITSATLAGDGSILVSGSFTAIQPTGLVVLGGSFNSVGGLPAKNLAQINGDGSVNAAFQANPNGPVSAVLPQPDGTFVVGGTFTAVAGASRAGIARFKADSTLDSAFNPSIGAAGVTTLAQQGAKILVGTNGLPGLIRLNADGSVDAGFVAGAPFVPAVAIAVQSDGKIVVAGTGSGVSGRVMRLNADGSIDSSFTTASVNGGNIQTLELQTDGSIIVAGSFTAIGGQNVANLARLTSSGAVDSTFNPAPNGSVTAVALQADGRLLIGGAFTSVGGLQRVALARLGNTAAQGTTAQTVGVSSDGKTLTWFRSGAAGELSGASFEWSSDDENWTSLGVATRVGSTANWQITGITGLPATGSFYVRTRGIAPSLSGRSASVYQTVREVNLASPEAGLGTIVQAYTSSTAWDQGHYVWTIDDAGVLRVSDFFSLVSLSASKTVLIGDSTPATTTPGARLADLATRGVVNPSSPLISGFAVTGTGSRTVLVRAVGPGLGNFGVSDYLKVPQLRLYNNTTGAVIGSNNGWNNDATLSAYFVRTGAFPLTAGSADSALVATLAPGTYSVQVVDGGGSSSTGGSALVEIYDAGDLSDTSSRLTNLSSRGTITSGGTLIGGLVVSGTTPRTMLVRGVGPALTRYGVGGVLSDPQIAVYDAQGNVVAANDNWGTSTISTASNADYASAISSAALTAGAFAFDPASKDAALVITLPAGAYTVQVSGVNGAAGAAMIEVYELP